MNDTDIRTEINEDKLKYLEKIEIPVADKKKKTDKKVIKTVVITLLALLLVIISIFGIKIISAYEGKEALPTEEIVYPEFSTSPEEIVISLKEMLEDTKSYGGVKLKIDFDAQLVDESVEITGDNAEAVISSSDYIKTSIQGLFSSEYDSQRYSGEYGDDFSSVLFSTQYLAHSVNISAQVNEENENDLKYIFDYNEDTVSVPGGEVVFRKIFDIASDTAAFNSIKEKAVSVANPENISFSYDNFIMTANIDRLKQELSSVQQKRVLDVTMPLSAIGGFEQFGTVNVKFTLELYKTFSFSRVRLSFKDDVHFIKKGSTDKFEYDIITDQSPSEIKVSFVSSDPSVLLVDDGICKGVGVSEDPVIVTASYTYKGVTYEDSCLYYVRVPVMGVKVADKEIAIKAGEFYKTKVSIYPSKATLKTVFWFTSDESVASVDASGVITANSPGVASVYCISFDGNYKSVCNVKVTG